jgi:hypothetical protein
MWQSKPVRYVWILVAGTLLFWLPFGILSHPDFYGVPLLRVVLILLLPAVAVTAGAVYLRRRYPEHCIATPLLMLLGILNVGPLGVAADIFPGSPRFPGLDLNNLVRYAGEVWDEFPLIAFRSVGGDEEGLSLALATASLLLLAVGGTWSGLRRPALLSRGGANTAANFISLFKVIRWVALGTVGVLAIVVASWWSFFTFEPFKHDQVTFDVPPQCNAFGGRIQSMLSHRWEGDALEVAVSESVNCAFSTSAVSAQVFGDRIFLRVRYDSPSGLHTACVCGHVTNVRLTTLDRQNYHVSLISWP